MEFVVCSLAKIDEVDTVRHAEDVGVTHFGAGEGPLLFSDPYQYLALAAQQTSSIKLGPYVTNPLTRIPAVTANSMATLNALAPGRTFLGLGAANNALRSMGNRVARMSELGDAVRISKGLLNGERLTQTWLGQEREIMFLDPDSGWYNIKDEVPMWVSTGGPKGLKIAAEQADAVAFCLGPDPEMIKLVRSELDRAVAEAGRAPGSVKLIGVSWFYLLRNGETWVDAITKGFGSGPISSCLTNLPMMKAHEDKLDPVIVEASRKAAMAYLGDPNDPNPPHYLDVWRSYMRGFHADHLPLITKELVDYWCLYGSPDDLQEKVQLMQECGVDMVSAVLSNPATVKRDITDIGTSIISRS
ncbi:LLM class flavin-dependent oxidoreductase [Pseudonocardia bannensis]|uniref:LLM class flavin-dependent oxidoreductase n=1 Tax=Pseudonocardia bannensis TaxID=630973 RepID=A0A848DH88_9PSEU|nr:LLM class flavin-dependent oxidoreductase [Pseudonocardia bannensis]NMH92042.1 LLM class flavin-dependent oxidoreductase [Pseudonocardia bannensis]